MTRVLKTHLKHSKKTLEFPSIFAKVFLFGSQSSNDAFAPKIHAFVQDEALPVLKGLRVVSAWPDLSKKLQKTSLGRTVNGLRHHRDANVGQVARELVNCWREECRKQRKEEKDMKKNILSRYVYEVGCSFHLTSVSWNLVGTNF